MSKYDSFEEKVIKKLKSIEEYLNGICEHTSDAVDEVSENDVSSIMDSMSNSLNDIADALADETYLNGTRYGSTFDGIKSKQDTMIKILEDVQDSADSILSELNNINYNIINMHDILVQAIRDAMNPEYEISSKETNE